MEDFNSLRQIPCFADLEEHDLKLLGRAGHEEDYPQGSMLIEEGQIIHYLYFILSGQLKVHLEKISGREVTLAVLRKGTGLGRPV